MQISNKNMQQEPLTPEELRQRVGQTVFLVPLRKDFNMDAQRALLKAVLEKPGKELWNSRLPAFKFRLTSHADLFFAEEVVYTFPEASYGMTWLAYDVPKEEGTL